MRETKMLQAFGEGFGGIAPTPNGYREKRTREAVGLYFPLKGLILTGLALMSFVNVIFERHSELDEDALTSSTREQKDVRA